jgi:hypothetical protein
MLPYLPKYKTRIFFQFIIWKMGEGITLQLIAHKIKIPSVQVSSWETKIVKGHFLICWVVLCLGKYGIYFLQALYLLVQYVSNMYDCWSSVPLINRWWLKQITLQGNSFWFTHKECVQKICYLKLHWMWF